MHAASKESASSTSSFAVQLRDGRVCVSGALHLTELSMLWRALRAATARVRSGDELDLDLTGVDEVDGAVAALLVELRAELAEQGVRSQIVGGSERVRQLVHLYRGYEPPRPRTPPPRRLVLERLGDAMRAVFAATAGMLEFLGDIVRALGGVVVKPIATNWRNVPAVAARSGADAVPIVLLLNFLVGLVMAYQSARQLETYGANVFVADVVGVSVTRELGPLVTAIIVAGRSGAAFAAELGTMKVSEEIDALRTMGFSPVRYLVLPRVAALFLVLPVLALLGDTVGVAGGAVVGATSLGVSPRAYLNELRSSLVARDIVAGMIKSAVFGIAIALIACEQGFAAQGGAAGVGRRATATVVSCLVAIVMIDAVFAVILRVTRQ